MLVYIHVPFCRTRCNYCAFYSNPLGRGVSASESPAVRDYVDSLFMEMALWGDRLAGKQVRSVFFGGGTPSLLPPRIIESILNRLHKAFVWADKAEVTLEANPESLRGGHIIRQYLDAGINRLSIGLQTLDDTLLRMLGRPHKAHDSLHAVFMAREAGCANISVDLMWGLPGQGVRQWLQTLKDVCRMGPDHISSYGLTLEEGTPMFQERGTLALPDEDEAAAMHEEGGALLEAAGYRQYEISNYARPGRECRHNMGYWRGEDYLGLGPAAVSCLDGVRVTQPADLAAWLSAVREGREAGDREVLGFAEKAEELVMLSLRTADGLDTAAYRALTGRDFAADNAALIAELVRHGMAGLEDGRFFLTRRGMAVSNAVMEQCFENIPQEAEQ